MTITIDLNQTVRDLCFQNPQIITILQELGFENITKPGMLQTAGRVMTIPNGCRMRGISLDSVKKTFQKQGYIVKENEAL